MQLTWPVRPAIVRLLGTSGFCYQASEFSVLNLPDRQMNFFQKIVMNPAHQAVKLTFFAFWGLVYFAIRLVNFVLNLPDRQVCFLGEFKLQKNCKSILLIKAKVLGQDADYFKANPFYTLHFIMNEQIF